jgi:hypothetical protein
VENLEGQGFRITWIYLSYELYINIVVLLIVKSRNLVKNRAVLPEAGIECWPMCRDFGAWEAAHRNIPGSHLYEKVQRRAIRHPIHLDVFWRLCSVSDISMFLNSGALFAALQPSPREGLTRGDCTNAAGAPLVLCVA